MTSRNATLEPTIKFASRALDERYHHQLKEVVVNTTLEGPDRFELVFHDPDHQLMEAGEQAIGDKVEIAVTLESESGAGRLIVGEVTALEAGYGPWGSTYTVRGYDRTHRLTRTRVTKAHVNVRYSDIARSIASAHGLVGDIDPTKVVHEHLLQANQTDWELLADLAREIGFEVGGHDGELYFRKPSSSADAPSPRAGASTSPIELRAADNLLEAAMTVSAAGQTRRVGVHGWDRKGKEPIVAEVPVETVTATPTERDHGAARLAKRVGGTDFSATAVPYGTTAEAREAANGLAERNASAAAELTGVTVGHPDLRAGAAVSVGGFGPHFNGRYTLTAVRHVVTPDESYVTEITASGARDHSLLGLAGGAVDGERGHRPRRPGVSTAVVTNVKDPDDVGRVKVSLPWLDAAATESDWAPVAQLLAGNGYGAMFLPEVGDEVLIAFDQGDLRHPYVVGSLYNGKDRPDKKGADLVASNGKVATRRLVTRGQHGLVFFDDAAKQGLRLRTGSEKVWIDLNQTDKRILITNRETQGTVEIDAAGKVTVDSRTDVTVKATGSVEFDAQGDFKVSATNIELKAKANASLEANAQLGLQGKAKSELKSGGQTDVSGGAMVQVKGAMVKIN